MVDEQVLVGPGDERGEPADELERLEDHVGGAVGPRGLECEAHAAVG